MIFTHKRRHHCKTRTFWRRVQSSNWTALELKIRQIASSSKSSRCAMKRTIWTMFQIWHQINRVGSRCQSVPGQAPIFNKTFFFLNFNSIRSRATSLSPLCCSRQLESINTQFDLKRSRWKFDRRSVRSAQSGSCCIPFDSEWWDKRIGVIFIRLLHLGQKV